MRRPSATPHIGVAGSNVTAEGAIPDAGLGTTPAPSDSEGLSSAEAAARLAANGPNTLPVPPAEPVWRELLAQMIHFFALLFWVAGALALLAGLPQLGVAVFVVILLNGIFAFVQERRAERAAERLRDLLPRRATVVRDGHATDVAAEDLVDGDVVLLADGSRVSADLRLVAAQGLAVDTSSLTGESVAEHPEAGDAVSAGSFVLEGEGRALVVATGPRTRLAGLAALTRAQRRMSTPLHQELARVSRLIALLAVVTGGAFFAVALALGTQASDGFLFAVGVTVALVPEGLLPTVTLSLAMGAQRMAQRNALVRHLEGVETLGSTTFICTDKTGTLTRNEMAVVEAWTPMGTVTVAGLGYEPVADVRCDPTATDSVRHLASVGARCSSGHVVEIDGRWEPRGDPMEAALDAFARRLGAQPESTAERARFPFDAHRRRMSVVTDNRVLVKGAPDSVLPRCAPVDGAERALAALAARGLRMLAVAEREVVPRDAVTAEDAERDLILLGLVALEDPPRVGAREAIRSCRRASIRVAMVTGDHPQTAVAIAREIELVTGEARVFVGEQLPSEDSELAELVDHDGIVLARVTPEDKLRIARVLRARGHVVAMTGDGVNDAPALREAAIGVAMGASGTDVAREAADLVLLDDDFATIVAAVEQGRATYANIRRFLTYHLTANVAELAPFLLWVLSGDRIPLAIGVLQVLCVDIVADVLPSLALGAEPPEPHVLERPPMRRHLMDRSMLTRAFGVLGPTEAVVELAAFLAVLVAGGWHPGVKPGTATMLAASGAAFTAIVIGQAANAFACRSTVRPVWTTGWRGNPPLLMAVAAQLALLAGLLFVPPLADLLDQAPPTALGFAIAVLAVPLVIVADALQKGVARGPTGARRVGAR